MKVLAINENPRKDWNTAHALKIIGKIINHNGIDFEIIQVGDKTIRGCVACRTCAKTRTNNVRRNQIL